MSEIAKRDIEKFEMRYSKAIDEILAEKTAHSIMDNSTADFDTMYNELFILAAGNESLSSKIYHFCPILASMPDGGAICKIRI